MRFIKSLILFYQKLILPIILLSTLIGYRSGKEWIGVSVLIIGPLIHYFTYENKNSSQYYFYYNIGWNKLSLWIATSLINFIIGITLIAL